MDKAIGVDVGGTFIKAALVAQNGDILKRARVETGVEGGAVEIEERILRLVEELGTTSLKGVGVGVPGSVRFPEGIVTRSPNIPAWSDYRAKERIGMKLGLPVVVDNDANMAALGESWMGAGRGCENFIMITLGTGIGAGIILGGRLWRGDTGRAGEIGHIVVEPGGAPCGCGSAGCVERYASAEGMRRIAKEKGLEGDVPKLMEMAYAGDEVARQVFEEAGTRLGLALGAWYNIMDVRTVVVGGGAAPAMALLMPHVKEVLKAVVYGVDVEDLRIVPAGLGEDAGILGGARMVLLEGDRL